jgi:hypothetical protein
VEVGVEKNTAIEGKAAPQLGGLRGWRDQHGAGAAIELHKNGCQPIELPALQPPLPDHAVHHLGLVETIHHHQPIDDLAVAAEGEFMRRTHERNDVTIDVGRQTPIELELGPASRFTPSERRKVEIGKTDRLLELVDPIAGKKHLRHVGFVTGDLSNRRPINVTTRQELDLVGERRFRRRNRPRTRAGCALLD